MKKPPLPKGIREEHDALFERMQTPRAKAAARNLFTGTISSPMTEAKPLPNSFTASERPLMTIEEAIRLHAEGEKLRKEIERRVASMKHVQRYSNKGPENAFSYQVGDRIWVAGKEMVCTAAGTGNSRGTFKRVEIMKTKKPVAKESNRGAAITRKLRKAVSENIKDLMAAIGPGTYQTDSEGVLQPVLGSVAASIDAQCKKFNDLAVEKGWYGPEEDKKPVVDLIMTKLMLIVSEVAEACEEVRNGSDFNEVRIREKDGKVEGFLAEMADIEIRVQDLIGELRRRGLVRRSYGEVVEMKHAFNKTRSHRHGGKKA